MSTLKPMPECDGPKLAAFADDAFSLDLEFMEIVPYESAHSIIVKTRINGRIYALKMVRNFWTPSARI